MFAIHQLQCSYPVQSSAQPEKTDAGSADQSQQDTRASGYSLGFDHFTPPAWLAAATTSELVCSELRRQVAEFASGQLVVHRCQVRRMRFRDSLGVWSGTFLLTIDGLPPALPGQTGCQIVPLHGILFPPEQMEHHLAEIAMINNYPFGADQWRCYLPALHLELRTHKADSELAMMPQLIDAEQARRLLEASMRNSPNPVYHDLHIRSCKPKIARYKPGSRCTLLYHLEYPPEAAQERGWPAVVVAKTYRGDKGQNAYDAMRALWRSPLGTSPTVRIAEPLAYLPELSVLVQGPVQEECTLKQLIQRELRKQEPIACSALEDDDGPGQLLQESTLLARYIRKTAAGLAELHQCGVHFGERVTWEDELAEIYEQRAKLAKPLPQLADLAEDLLDRLKRLASAHPADAMAPAHRSFRPAQVLLSGGEIGFIDFDGFCQAEPALDLALFMTTVKSLALKASGDDNEEEEGEQPDTELHLHTKDASFRRRLVHAEAICQLFLTEYEKYAAVSRMRILLWETLDLLSLVLGSWAKLKLARLDNVLWMLHRHLIVNEI